MGAAIIAPGAAFPWTVGGAVGKGKGKAEAQEDDDDDDDDDVFIVRAKSNRKTYVHLPMTQQGGSKIRLLLGGEREDDVVLEEGDGAFVENVNAGDELLVESIGGAEAEVVVLDSN